MALDSDDWVVISTVQGQVEEAQLRAFLHGHDILTQVRGETLRRTHGLSIDGPGQPWSMSERRMEDHPHICTLYDIGTGLVRQDAHA